MSDRDEVLMCPHCDVIRAACDLNMAQEDKDWQKEKRNLIKLGYVFDVVITEDVRGNFGNHKNGCPLQKPLQKRLFKS